VIVEVVLSKIGAKLNDWKRVESYLFLSPKYNEIGKRQRKGVRENQTKKSTRTNVDEGKK